MFSTFENWTEVAEWYAQLERYRRNPTNEIRVKADEITRGLETEEDRARALYYWVSQNIRYVSLSFGVGRYQPHSANEVLTNRYGDCKDKTSLLEAMLEAEGLHAQSVLVSLSSDIEPDVPNPMQFDHAIVLLRLGTKEQWLDSTAGVAPFGYLLPQLRNSRALVVSQWSSASLRTLPQEFPFPVQYRVTVEGQIDSRGTLDAKVELQTRGDLEVLIRSINDRVSQEQLSESADSILTRTNRFLYGAYRYTDFKVANPTDISTPVKAQFHATGKPVFVDQKATRTQVMDAVAYGLMRQLMSLKLLPTINADLDSRSDHQQAQIELNGPRSYSLDLKLAFTELPESDLPSPKEFHLKQEFGEFQSRDLWEGSTFRSSKSLDLSVATLPASDSAGFAGFVKKITDAFPEPAKQKIESKSSSAAAKSQLATNKYFATPEAQDLYNRGEEEFKRKNWANAVEAYASATKADPHFPDAWRELGRAHMYARQHADAEPAFRKYLELAPNDRLAYLNMAWVLFNERKFEEDRDLMLKRVAAAPDDGDALFRLGVAYLALHQPQEAVPVLERSVTQFPRYLAAHMALARAYLENHQDLLAQSSLRKAVAIDGNENTLDSAAYMLSEHGVFLDLAEEWSQRSVDVVEKELNDLILTNLQSSTWGLVAKISHYWDTLGWISFKLGKIDSAEKYVLAACQIDDESPLNFHLGRIYQTQGHSNEAIELYLSVLKAAPPNGSLSEDAKEARRRLGELVGEAQVEDRLKQFHRSSTPVRTASVANSGGEQGISQYTVMIDANSKTVELSSTIPDDPLTALKESIRATVLPQSFPDTTLKKLPRVGTVACSAGTQPCVLTLLPVHTGSRIAPVDLSEAPGTN